jgi:ADP-ribose pyrophosphatase YjhB (NUDIX family)
MRMLSRRSSLGSIAILLAFSLLSTAPDALAREVYNLTGLPVYPYLTTADMDDVARTDTMGHWCTRFTAQASAPLEVVEDWYRKALVNASETNLRNDQRYRDYLNLTGIKLAVGVDYVTVFRAGNQPTTSIELFKCSRAK